MRIGVHCSVRKGFVNALKQADQLGCDTLQMFSQSPRGWRTLEYTEEDFSVFRAERSRLKIGPVVLHAPYLPNLCTTDAALRLKSIDALKADFWRCDKLAADYLVIHPGAYSPGSTYEKGIQQIHSAINEAMREVSGSFKVLIENVAGGGRRIGGRFFELRDLLSGIEEKDRFGICFDTCHAFGAGYDLRTKRSVEETIEEFDREVGVEKIFAFHVNDSSAPLGSHRDIHEHLGNGHIGTEGLSLFLNRPVFHEAIFILETPRDSVFADKKNIRALRSCLSLE